MKAKTRLRLIGLGLWVVPMFVFLLMRAVLFHGSPWWWWLPIVALCAAWNALLEWYAFEFIRAELSTTPSKEQAGAA